MSGRSKERQALADEPLPLEAGIPVLPARGGEAMVRRLFEPLGYAVETFGQPLHPSFPAWGESPLRSVRLSGTVRLRDLLGHLYVLIPVLDDQKHYWVAKAEIDKLLRRGEGWLAGHPERDFIARRYLARQTNLTREALRRLVAEEQEDPEAEAVERDTEEAVVEERVSLQQQRIGAVLAALRSVGARRILDLGCGEGRLLAELAKDHSFNAIVGVDVSTRSLEIAARRLRVERMNERQRERLRLMHGSLTYRDDRLAGFDAAVLMEVIEHIEPIRLPAVERAVFEFARPSHVVVTTPNVEYNVRFEGMPAGRLRHRDHRFEWSRSEFAAWSARVADRFGYAARHLPVGPEDPEVGPPTQLAVFSR
jgi:3' terminal RNA ribose 2'-O-methyltransferase Hen1